VTIAKQSFKKEQMNRLRHFIEWQVFGVCSFLGEKMGIASATIRKHFIYISLLTAGSPIIFYIFVAFWMNVKNYILSAKRNPLRYL
jgi:phage shock protein PspC (stress-responsive transcriptional regulator)